MKNMKKIIFYLVSLVGVLMLLAMVLTAVGPPPSVQAQGTWPRCISGCTSNDVIINSVWMDVPPGNYTPGETVTGNVSMDLYFHRQNTYCIVVVADLYVGGVHNQTDWVSDIIDYHSGGGNATYSMGTVNWTYGELFEMRNVLVEWSQNDPKDGCPMDCSNYVNSKCTKVANITVTTPLVADFDFNNVCYCNNTIFTNNTTGGVKPYTYDWDFGDGNSTTTQNATYHYASNGTYTVTLNVTDSDSPPNSASQSYNVTVYANPTVTLEGDTTFCEGGNATITANVTGGTPSYDYDWSASTAPGVDNDGSFTATGNGTVEVTVTDANNCTASDNVTVTVVEACEATAPDFSICEGTTVNEDLFTGQGANCSAGCNMTLDYSGVNSSTPGTYSYNVTCNGGVCGEDVATGNVTVVARCEATATNFSICVDTGQGANCSAGCNMTLDYSGVNSSKAGIYSYNVTCNNGVCDPTTETGNVTVVEACEATAPDFSICEGTTVNEDLSAREPTAPRAAT